MRAPGMFMSQGTRWGARSPRSAPMSSPTAGGDWRGIDFPGFTEIGYDSRLESWGAGNGEDRSKARCMWQVCGMFLRC